MMIDRRARASTNTALITIRSILDASENPEDFLIGVDELLVDPANLLTLPVDYGHAEELTPHAGGRSQDTDNGPAVYEFLGALDPSNASDPRLWTYLAFSTYRDYMARRWPLTVENWKGRVKDRWLLQNATRGKLIRHGIARLWWVTSLLYDAQRQYPLAKQRDDAFAYARAAFRSEDRINALFDRDVSSVRVLARCVLEYAESSNQVTDNHIRALMKEVTLIYGYRDIELLGDEAVTDLVRELTT